MRYIGKEEIEKIAIGAAVLGTGGGGDPHIGMLMAIAAIEKYGPIKLISPNELEDNAVIVPVAMMGAPTVLVEKIPSGKEAKVAFQSLEELLGKKITATMAIEAGGVNSLLPFSIAAEMNIPLVDCDGMGRAFPELQMVTFYLNDVSSTPMVLADEKGNSVILNTVNGKWTEKIARVVTSVMGGSSIMSIYPMTGKQLKAAAIYNSISLEENIGSIILDSRKNNKNPISKLLELLKGFELFSGKIIDVERKTEGGFVRGRAKIEGLNKYSKKTGLIQFQNENLILTLENGSVLCTTPDLIIILDSETGDPITTETLRYGHRCTIIGAPADEKWRTPKGIEVVGPKYFGYNLDYVPLEKLHLKNNNIKISESEKIIGGE